MKTSALDVYCQMDQWWQSTSKTALSELPRDAASALYVGVKFLISQNLPEYEKLQQVSSKISYFRQMLTVWKAVCARLAKHKPEFFDENLDAVKTFAFYLEQSTPKLYVLLLEKNVFLGVQFNDADRARQDKIHQDFVDKAAAELRQEQNQAFARIFFGPQFSSNTKKG